jgi:hypothetical protein
MYVVSSDVYSDNTIKCPMDIHTTKFICLAARVPNRTFLHVPTTRKARQACLRISARPSAAMALAQGNPVPRPACSTPPPKTLDELPAINSSPLADFNGHPIITPPKRARKPIEPALVGVKGKHGVAKRKRCVDHEAYGPRIPG